MRYHLLGQTGLRVAEIFLGAMTFQHTDSDATRQYRGILDTYAEAGGNVIDTAVNYGESETVLGELLAGRRDQFVLATKYTGSRDPSNLNAAGNHRKNLTRSLETSLRRLRTDHIDLYWVHTWDPHTPIEETMRALDDAVRAGKILYTGISNAPAWLVSRANTLADWRGWTPLVALQVRYNLLNRDIERELLPMAEAFGMSVAAWGPLAHGVLSGKFTGPATPADTRIKPDTLTERDHTAARAVCEVADQLGATPTQVALAWTRTRSRAVHPIVGARNADQLRDSLGAVGLELPPHAVDHLSAAVEFHPGYPHDFLAANRLQPWLFGTAIAELTGRR
jgi:aryl-alcohol dehydrogenase-like predicted oxidoreductase